MDREIRNSTGLRAIYAAANRHGKAKACHMGERAVHLIALGANLPSARGAPRATLEAALAGLEARGLRGRGPQPLVAHAGLAAGVRAGLRQRRRGRSTAPTIAEAVLAALHAVEAGARARAAAGAGGRGSATST